MEACVERCEDVTSWCARSPYIVLAKSLSLSLSFGVVTGRLSNVNSLMSDVLKVRRVSSLFAVAGFTRRCPA